MKATITLLAVVGAGVVEMMGSSTAAIVILVIALVEYCYEVLWGERRREKRLAKRVAALVASNPKLQADV